MPEKIERLKKGLGTITNGCAYIKLDENGELEYIRIDNRKFTNIDKMPEQIIDYSRNIQKAIKIMRGYHSLEDLPDNIPNFVIKYHPSWINLRQQAGYLNNVTEEGEIPCTYENEINTYKEWMSDIFIALGVKEYYPKKLNPDALMSESVFLSVVRPEGEGIDNKALSEITDYIHRDTHAFMLITRWKSIIDNDGNDEVDISKVRYKLDRESHFPVLVTGTNKNQKEYDFRKPLAILSFYKYLTKKNSGNMEIRDEVKKLEKVIRGY